MTHKSFDQKLLADILVYAINNGFSNEPYSNENENDYSTKQDIIQLANQVLSKETLEKYPEFEIKKPDLDAKLVAEGIARDLERRIAFRRAQKQAIQRTMRAGAKGIKTMVSGRLNGADIARSESYSEGTVPLHTLRADIDYAWEEADTTYGKLGVKTWIYRDEVLPTRKNKNSEKGGK